MARGLLSKVLTIPGLSPPPKANPAAGNKNRHLNARGHIGGFERGNDQERPILPPPARPQRNRPGRQTVELKRLRHRFRRPPRRRRVRHPAHPHHLASRAQAGGSLRRPNQRRLRSMGRPNHRHPRQLRVPDLRPGRRPRPTAGPRRQRHVRDQTSARRHLAQPRQRLNGAPPCASRQKSFTPTCSPNPQARPPAPNRARPRQSSSRWRRWRRR